MWKPGANSSAPTDVLYDVNDVALLSDLARAASTGDERDYEALVRALWPNAYRIAWSSDCTASLTSSL